MKSVRYTVKLELRVINYNVLHDAVLANDSHAHTAVLQHGGVNGRCGRCPLARRYMPGPIGDNFLDDRLLYRVSGSERGRSPCNPRSSSWYDRLRRRGSADGSRALGLTRRGVAVGGAAFVEILDLDIHGLDRDRGASHANSSSASGSGTVR